jgi:hypothetical protein
MERIAADEWIDEAFDDEDDEAAEAQDARLVERLTVDLAALEARVLKDQAFDGAAVDLPKVEQSRQAYEAIWRRMGSPYAGVNAASMALASGKAEEAQRLADEVLKRLPKEPKDYWAVATAAEALLVSGDKERGISILSKASQAEDASDAHKATTALQLSRLAPWLGVGADELKAALAIKSVAVVTGHMFRGTEMDAAAQNDAAAAIRAEAEAVFARRNVGNVFSALACGSDIVVAEAALDAGIPFHAVVPFPLPRYVALSVEIGDPEGDAGHWRRRFDDALQRAASLTLIDDELPLDRDLDGHFFYGFRYMAGLVLMRAAALQAECRLIAVTDGTHATNLAGSSQAAADWLEAGRPVDPIAFPHKRKAPAGRARGASTFRPVVFLWDAAGGRADKQVLKKAGVAKRKDLAAVERASRVGGAGSAVVAPSLAGALAFAAECTSSGKEASTLRVVCDFGPALGGDLKPDAKAIARLEAGSDMPGFPPGKVLATQSFAAQAVVELGGRLDVNAVGRVEESRDAEAGRARRRPSVPVYKVGVRSAPQNAG